MKRTLMTLAALTLAGLSPAHADTTSYQIVTTFLEPDTQPKDTIFKGSFDYDAATHTISKLQGQLSESMTGSDASDMNWLQLDHQLASWYDAALGGSFAAVFLNGNTNTFWTGMGGDGWSPAAGVAAGGVYYGFPRVANNPGNAYALIFVPDAPLSALTQAQIDRLAYADCAPGGMMGAVCMTGTTVAGYGAVGTMNGYPVSQTISAIAMPVPEPGSYALLLAGLGLVGACARRRTPR